MIGTSQQQEASSILCIVIGDDQVISTLAYLGQFQWILLVTSWRMYNETTLWIQSTTNSFFFVKIILFFDDDRSAQPQQSWKKSSKHTALFFCQQHSFLKLCEYRNIHHFLGQKLTIFFWRVGMLYWQPKMRYGCNSVSGDTFFNHRDLRTDWRLYGIRYILMHQNASIQRRQLRPKSRASYM